MTFSLLFPAVHGAEHDDGVFPSGHHHPHLLSRNRRHNLGKVQIRNLNRRRKSAKVSGRGAGSDGEKGGGNVIKLRAAAAGWMERMGATMTMVLMVRRKANRYRGMDDKKGKGNVISGNGR